jgi:hypothetical protein
MPPVQTRLIVTRGCDLQTTYIDLRGHGSVLAGLRNLPTFLTVIDRLGHMRGSRHGGGKMMGLCGIDYAIPMHKTIKITCFWAFPLRRGLRGIPKVKYRMHSVIVAAFPEFKMFWLRSPSNITVTLLHATHATLTVRQGSRASRMRCDRTIKEAPTALSDI